MLKFQVREDELLTRLKRRARADDTDEVTRHRFKRMSVFREKTAPRIRYYRKEFITIDEVGAIDGVFTPSATSPTAITTDPKPAGGLAMKETLGNARRQHRRPVFNRQLDDDYRQADRPTLPRDMPRPPSRAWDGMTGPLRVGVIGANPNRSWAKDSHIPALRSLENVQLAAVATTSRASAEAAAAAFGVRAAYDDPLALITASDIDIVSVCVRVPYHRDLVLAALAVDKHVYCEWPLGRDRGEAAEMAAAARTRAVHAAIGLQAHMNPAARRAAELIAAGAIGRPLTARIFSSTAGFAPRLPAAYAYLNTIESGANLITILGGHTLDLAILVLGGIDSLAALTTLQHPTVTLTDTGEQIHRTAPDHLLVQARMISGCALAVEVAGNRAPDTPFTFEVVGTDGGLLLAGGHPNGFEAGRLALSLNGARQQVDEPPDTLPAAAVNVAAMYCALARDISSGEHTTPDFDHAVRLTHLLDDVVQSANTGHRLTRQNWPTSDSSYQ